MKKVFRWLLLIGGLLLILFFALRTYTKSHSPAATVTSAEEVPLVQVNYARPLKKGRIIFGQLVPYNTVWRTGANEATTINFATDMQIADKQVKAGKYSLWTIPKENSWTIILNAETGQWGTNYDEAKDVLRVDVPSTHTPEVVEQLTISLSATPNGTMLQIAWDKTQVNVPLVAVN